MDVGPAKQRPRSTADVTKIESVTMYMTGTQLAILDAFYRDTLGFGSEAFEWKHPRTGNPVDARFTEAPKYTPQAPRQNGAEYWKVDMVLELLPGTEQITPPPPPPPPPPPLEEGIYFAPEATSSPPTYEAVWTALFDEPDNAPPAPGDSDFIYLAPPASNDDHNNAMFDPPVEDPTVQLGTIVSVDSLPISGGTA